MDDHLVILTFLITVLQVLGEEGEKVQVGRQIKESLALAVNFNCKRDIYHVIAHHAQVEENNGDDVTPVLTEEKWVGVKGQRVKGGGVKDSRGTYFFCECLRLF